MRGLLHDLCWCFVFQLNLTLPRGLLRALHGCRLRPTKWCACIVWRHIKLTEPARPGPVSVCLSSSEAVTRPLTFTSRKHRYLLESQSLIRCLLLLLLSVTHCSPPPVTVPHYSYTAHAQSPLPVSLPGFYGVQTSRVCKGPPVSTAGISLLPACITENFRVEHSHQGWREGSLLLGCTSPATSTVFFCWQLASGHCTLFLCMDK